MAESPTSSSTVEFLHDNITTEDHDKLIDTKMLLASGSVLQGLNESRAELLSHVQSLKKDLQDWRGNLDKEVDSYNEDIGDLKFTLNSDIEQLTNEFQELKNTLKEQLAVTTSKLVELDTSVIDCAQYLEGLNSSCEIEKSLFDDLIVDLGLQNHGKKENQETLDYSHSTDSSAPASTAYLEEVEE